LIDLFELPPVFPFVTTTSHYWLGLIGGGEAFADIKDTDMNLTNKILLVPKLKMNSALPPLIHTP